MPNFIVLVGLPASGKSTYIRENDFSDYIIVSSDNVVEQHAHSVNKTYDEVFDDMIDIASNVSMETLRTAIQFDKNIIVDQTNISEKSRRKKLSNVPKYYKKIAVVFEIDEDIRVSRYETRKKELNKSVPTAIIENMKKYFQYPSYEEGFDEIITIKG